MSETRLLVRTDAGPKVGHGHVVRCLALATMLREQFDIAFCLVESASYVSDMIQTEAFEVRAFADEEGFFGEICAKDLVLTDGYSFDEGYQLEVKKRAMRLICIDDLVTGYFHADLIINHCPGIRKQAYQCPPYTKFCLGPSYALLRPAFHEIAREAVIQTDRSGLLICFGGSDPDDYTRRLVEEVLTMNCFSLITVILGSGYAGISEMLRLQHSSKNKIAVLRSLTAADMIRELCAHAVIVVPASGLLFEALACKSLVVSGYYLNNQRRIYEGFKALSAFIDAGTFERQELAVAMKKALVHHELPGIPAASEIIDGRAPERLRQAFENLTTAR